MRRQQIVCACLHMRTCVAWRPRVSQSPCARFFGITPPFPWPGSVATHHRLQAFELVGQSEADLKVSGSFLLGFGQVDGISFEGPRSAPHSPTRPRPDILPGLCVFVSCKMCMCSVRDRHPGFASKCSAARVPTDLEERGAMPPSFRMHVLTCSHCHI